MKKRENEWLKYLQYRQLMEIKPNTVPTKKYKLILTLFLAISDHVNKHIQLVILLINNALI